MIYERLVALPSDITEIEYLFINGDAWTDSNESGNILQCGNVYGNRTLSMDGQSEIILSANATGAPYCFNQCSSCVLLLQVTFTVDMSVVSSVSDQGVHIAGSFQGWDAESTMLTDNGDGTWSTTLKLHLERMSSNSSTVQVGTAARRNMNGTSCNAGGNRGAEFDEENNTYEACFNICPGESCLPDPDPANLTFQVDASEVDLGGESMFIFGAFTGWQGGAIPMTDNGDGTWQTTQLVSGSANVDYKYSIGAPSEGNDESGSYVLAGDSTTFEMEGCGVGNGFGGYNRRFVRSGIDEVIPLHCFNSCSACLDDGGCTDSEACNYVEMAMTDDGSCTYPGDACDDMDDMTINDMLQDECWCVGEEIVLGCTDPSACNYTTDSIVDDGSCSYEDAVGVCGGECFADYDGDGICDEFIVLGCTFEIACNYSFESNVDDGSCLVVGEACDDGNEMTINDMLQDECWCVGEEIVLGCTDPSACNYDSEANVDDGSCDADCAGCTDIHAVNFDSGATEDDGSCEFWSPGCDACQSNFDFGGAPFGVSPDPSLGQSFTDGHLGLPYTDAWHVLVPPTAAGIDSCFPTPVGRGQRHCDG